MGSAQPFGVPGGLTLIHGTQLWASQLSAITHGNVFAQLTTLFQPLVVGLAQSIL